MHIRAGRTLLLLIAAGILNILVAWGLSLIPHVLGPANTRASQIVWNNIQGERASLYILRHAWFGVVEEQFHTTRRSRTRDLPSQISIWWAWSPGTKSVPANQTGTMLFDEFQPDQPDSTIISHTSYGFPALSLQCDSLLDDSAPLPNGSYATATHGVFFDRVDSSTTIGKPEVWPHAQYLWLPYRPIWTGFIINTVVYFIIILLMAFIWTRLKYARRMLKGRCPHCAYELHSDFRTGCSECGWRHATQSIPPNE